MKHLSTITVLLIAFALAVIPAYSQEPPAEVQVAFNALSAHVGNPVNFETIAGLQWEAHDFADASLGCPVPGEMYTQVITPGYQFFINYAGMSYDYRVAEDSDRAVLCDSYPAIPPTEPISEEPTSDCGAYYEVQRNDTLTEIAQECGTTIEQLMAVNPDIVDPSLIYAGQRLAIPAQGSPYTVSIAPDSGPPGTMLMVTASGFPPGARVQVGLGRFRSEYDVYATREIGDNGTLTATVNIPTTATIGEEWMAVVVLNRQESISEVFEVTTTALFEQTQIYLVAVGDTGRSGIEIGCGDSLVPVTVSIQPTIAPLAAALEEMFSINTRTYGQSGLYNALYRSELSVQGIDIEDGEAIINLTGELRIGGTCDIPRIEQQLRQTALQYSTIDSVTISINGVPLAEALR